jgi:hypothetical protein
MVHMWFVMPAAMAGVMRRVWWWQMKLQAKFRGRLTMGLEWRQNAKGGGWVVSP